MTDRRQINLHMHLFIMENASPAGFNETYLNDINVSLNEGQL